MAVDLSYVGFNIAMAIVSMDATPSAVVRELDPSYGRFEAVF